MTWYTRSTKYSYCTILLLSLGEFVEKKPDYQLVYIYTKKKFKADMWRYFFIWLALRIARAVLYLTVGIAYMSSIPAAFIFFGTGMVWGFAILAVVIYRRSSRPDPGVEIQEEEHHPKH